MSVDNSIVIYKTSNNQIDVEIDYKNELSKSEQELYALTDEKLYIVRKP